jgi:hypothetical protein
MAKSTAITLLLQVAGLSGRVLCDVLDSSANRLGNKESQSDTVFKKLTGVKDAYTITNYINIQNSYWNMLCAPLAHAVLAAYFLAQTIYYFGIAARYGDSEYLNTALTSFLTAILSAILIAPSFFINLLNKVYGEAPPEEAPSFFINLFNQIEAEVPPKDSKDGLSNDASNISLQHIVSDDVDNQSFSVEVTTEKLNSSSENIVPRDVGNQSSDVYDVEEKLNSSSQQTVLDDVENQPSLVDATKEEELNSSSQQTVLDDVGKQPSSDVSDVEEKLNSSSQQTVLGDVGNQPSSDVSDVFDFLLYYSIELWEVTTNNFCDMVEYLQSSITYAKVQDDSLSNQKKGP